MQVLFASFPNLWKYDAKSGKIRISIAEFRLWCMKFSNVFANIPHPLYLCNKLGHFIEIKATIPNVILSPLQIICYEVARSFRIAGFQSIYILFCRFISRLKCELSVLLRYLLVLILSANIAFKNFKMDLRKERLRCGLSVKGLVWQETCYAYVTWRIMFMFGMFSCSVLSICSAHDRWGITRGRHNVYCLVKSSPFVDPFSNRFINGTTHR
jgi:hypothetical protein